VSIETEFAIFTCGPEWLRVVTGVLGTGTLSGGDDVKAYFVVPGSPNVVSSPVEPRFDGKSSTQATEDERDIAQKCLEHLRSKKRFLT